MFIIIYAGVQIDDFTIDGNYDFGFMLLLFIVYKYIFYDVFYIKSINYYKFKRVNYLVK